MPISTLTTPRLQALLAITKDANGTLSLQGDVDGSNVREFEAALTDAMNSGGAVVLDLTDLQFIDVAGVRVLERAANRLSSGGSKLVLASPPAILHRVMEALDIDELIEVAA
jgi:anti-anti-sigma factor